MKGQTKLIIILSAFACILLGISLTVFFVSRSSSRAGTQFSASLSGIDELIISGKNHEALNRLQRLRRSAGNTGQWLSIVKRERSISAYGQAAETLYTALKQFPVNEILLAVLVDTLILAGREQEAEEYSDVLISTPLSALPAYVRINATLDKSPAIPSLDPKYASAAYSVTADPVFRRNAAVLYARQGAFRPAISLYPPAVLLDEDFAGFPPQERYFASLLYYDAGLYERVFLFLQEQDLEKMSFDELMLSADAAWALRDFRYARACWQLASEKYSRLSPLPWYNSAAAAEDPVLKKTILKIVFCISPRFILPLRCMSEVFLHPFRQILTLLPPIWKERAFLRLSVSRNSNIRRLQNRMRSGYSARLLPPPAGNRTSAYCLKDSGSISVIQVRFFLLRKNSGI
ncbi:hypothetical protein K7I13_04720 [Brucepastera parasyntrophica]|uniref:hypothetical protein n=1 Tax=Brucepastera parasyntrophica TaxID=2880008 RepID=UPI00210A42FB|nr:hypothetical protein [Brucepastera parasyntrophica]ULQ60589.1 hypothetical protein K7I13_04720 [Brucepastera parasyntrophica]